MHIAFDFRPALRQSTGVGTYIHNLVAALSEAYPEDAYTVFSASLRDRLDRARAPAGVELTDWRIPVRSLDWAWHRWRWPGVERFVGPVDVAHSPSPMLLPTRSGRTVITVHDCYFMRHPEDVYGPVRDNYVPLARGAAQSADAVVVISESTAREAEELLGIPRQKMSVIHLGVDQVFFDGTRSSATAILGQHGVDRPFFLFVGRREKRKDLATLLTAFDEILADGEDLQLVLVGPDAPGWDQTWSAASTRVQQSTRLIPYQPLEQLPGLYAAAAALVMPSRWEGFGLTGLEAMASGTPVIATEVGALPEVLGDAALFAPPGDAEALAQQFRRLLHDAGLAREMRAAGRRCAAGYRWSDTARRTHDLYRKLCS